jgi:protein SCO1
MIRTYAMIATALLAAMLGALGYMVWRDGRAGDDQFAQCRATQIAGGSGALGGPFTLTDHTGTTVTEASFADRPTILYFGYTFCPDVCPLDNARNAEAVDLLAAKGHDVTPVFITVDPERDTQEVMAEFVRFMHPKMIGLTGTAEQLRDAARAYRVYFAKQDAQDEFYLVDHSTFAYLLLPGHGFVDIIRRDQSAQQVADMVGCFIDQM